MPPPKQSVWKHFNQFQNEEDKPVASCKYCDEGRYTFPNATRMARHIIRQCKHAPEVVKEKLRKEKKNGKSGDSSSQEVDDPNPVENASEISPSKSSTSAPASFESGVPVYSVKKRKLQTIQQYMDQISDESISKVDKLFARAAYYGGLPNSVYESNPFFHEACKELRPAYPGPPNSYKLRKPLLEAEYATAKSAMDLNVSKALCVSFMCDGWTNCKQEGLINFMVGTPEIQFLKAIESGTNCQTGAYLGGELITVVEEVGPPKVLHVTTDNAANNRLAWRILTDKYPHIFTTGCVSHGLDLLCEDLVKLAFLRSIKTKAKCIVKLKNKKVVNATFKEKQRLVYGSAKRANALVRPSPTRFHGDEIMFSSVLKNKEALVQLALSSRVTLEQRAKSAILDDTFWSDLEIAIAILKPIAKGIKILESDDQMMSLVPRVFMDIKNCLTEVFAANPQLSQVFVNSALKCLSNRINYCVCDIHKAAYLLDPRFRGEGLTDSEILDSLEVISKIAKELDLNCEDVLDNVTLFRRQDGFFSRGILYNGIKSSNFKPAAWWASYANLQPARPVAERILMLHPTACCCERNWSDFNLIQCGGRRRHRLANDRTAKLVTVRGHLRKGLKKKRGKPLDVKYYLDIEATALTVEFDDDDLPLGEARREEGSESEVDSPTSSSESDLSDEGNSVILSESE